MATSRKSAARKVSALTESKPKLSAEKAPSAAARPARRGIVSAKFEITLNAKNGLRRILFVLEKNTSGAVVDWKIHFKLLERAKKTDPYGDPLVEVKVSVAAELNDKAQKAADKGLTAMQSSHVLGPAAEDAKAVKTGEIPVEDAEATIEDTLRR